MFAVLMCGLTFSSNAQKINWGQKIAMSADYSPVIVGEDDKHFYSVFYHKSNFNIEKFEKGSNSRVYQQKLTLPKKQEVEKIVFAKDKFIVFMSYFDKKADETIIYANTYSADNGGVLKVEQKILVIPVEKKRRRGSFGVVVADGADRLLVTHDAYYKKQKKYRERFLLLNSNLEKVTEREDVIDESKVRNYSTSGFAIDGDGSFYYMKNYTDGRRNIVSYDATRDFDKWEETIDYQKLGLPLKSFIYNMSVTTNKKKDLIFVGYYSKSEIKITGKVTTHGSFQTGVRYSLDGAFYLKIDHISKEIVQTKLNEFSQEFKDQFRSKSDVKKNRDGKIYDQFGELSMYKKDDGGIIGVGEVFTGYHYISRNHESLHYYYGDLITISLSPDGDLQWANRIKKSQTFGYESFGPFIFSSTGFKFLLVSHKPLDYMGYFAALGKDKFYVAYNDNAKNLQKKSDQDKLKPFKKPKEAVMSMYTIDLATGERKKSAFFGGKDFEVTVEPNTAFQTGQNTKPIIMASRKKNFKFGIMEFE